MIIEGSLSAGHGRVLVTVDAAERNDLISQIIDDGLSVRALEALVRNDGEPTTSESAPDSSSASGTPESAADVVVDDSVVGVTKPPALLELEELLGDLFATKVGITLGNKRGRLTIDFADIDDLERIYALMTEIPIVP